MKPGDLMQVWPDAGWVRAWGVKQDGRPDIMRGLDLRGGDLVLLVAHPAPGDLVWQALWNGTLICISSSYLYPCEGSKAMV